MLLIKFEDYDIKNQIREDKLGFLFEAIEKQTGKLVEFRVFDFYYFFDSNIPFFQRTIDKVCQLNLPGLVKIHGYRLPLTEEEEKQYETNPQMKEIHKRFPNPRAHFGSCILVTDFEKCHQLDELTVKYLKNQGQGSILNSTIRSKIIFGIASIMKRAHKHDLIHSDLNLSYIYLDEKFEPKIANFGSVQTAINSMHSPNQATGCGYKFTLFIFPDKTDDLDDLDDYEDYWLTKEYDVLLFGLLVFQMFETYLNNFRRSVMRGKTPQRPESFESDSYWDLIVRCVRKNPNERPSFAEIVENLKNDQFAIEEFGMKTDLNDLHEYQERIDSD